MTAQALFLWVFTLFTSISLMAQETPFNQAQEELTPVLIYFSGSDWCMPCKTLKKTVIEHSEFKSNILNKTVFYTADFPVRTQLPKAEKTLNEHLCEQYNPEGVFPLLVLVEPNGEIITQIGKTNEDVQFYISYFQKGVKN